MRLLFVEKTHRLALRAAIVFALAASSQCLAIVSSSPSPLAGIDINSFLGADTFYSAGYTGSRAIVANVEGGWAWNGQESLTSLNTFMADPAINAQVDRHATWVAAAIAGQPTLGGGEHQRGIAYGATLWSGAIAKSWNSIGAGGYSLSFNYDTSAFLYAYSTAMQTGAGGVTADVINSSWSLSNGANGNSPDTRIIDALAYSTGKTVVFAAGNGGSANTVNAPLSGMNVIVVGSLGSDTTNPQYNSPSTSSSRSPSDLFIPFNATGTSGTNLSAVRALVDIAAPGENLTLAEYDGGTGGNQFGGATSSATNQYTSNLNGTSFAAPLVAGGAALIVDAGKANFPTDAKAIDGRVVKAVLMNSADKTAGWNNGQNKSAGVITTTQALDYAVGTGRMDLDLAFEQFLHGTTDLPGTNGGLVGQTGWDYGRVASGVSQNYLLSGTIAAGSTLTTTLDWFADDKLASGGSYGSFDTLDLQVYTYVDGSIGSLVAQSISPFSSVQHLSFAVPSTNQYLIAVNWGSANWNFAGDPAADDYGLAWSVTSVPEPVVIVLAPLVTILLSRKNCTKALPNSRSTIQTVE